MWSHYAAEHKGVCIEFDTQNGRELLKYAWQVEYSREYPTYECFNLDPSEIVRRAVFRKSTDWSYEKECRLIINEKAGTTDLLPPETIVGVILGARISDSDEEDVLRWVEQSKVPPILYRAKLKGSEYGLEIVGL